MGIYIYICFPVVQPIHVLLQYARPWIHPKITKNYKGSRKKSGGGGGKNLAIFCGRATKKELFAASLFSVDLKVKVVTL